MPQFWRSTPITSSDGSPRNLHTTDAQDPARQERELARDWLYAFAIQTLDYALLFVDPDKRILWANPGAAWTLAATVSEIVGSSVTAYFTPDDITLGIPDHEQRSALRQGSSDDDRWMVRADGSRFWASGKTVALTHHDGTPMGFFKIFRDQTEFKMRIDALNIQAGAADAQRGEAAAAGGSEPLSVEAEWRAAIAGTDSGNRIIRLTFPEAATIWCEGNRARLREAFATLLEEAIRATREDGHIWINGTTESTQVVMQLEHDGRGLDAAALQQLFEVFTRPLSPRSGSKEQGLERVRRIVDEHGGTIQVHSAGADKGRQFFVRLPLREVTLRE